MYRHSFCADKECDHLFFFKQTGDSPPSHIQKLKTEYFPASHPAGCTDIALQCWMKVRQPSRLFTRCFGRHLRQITRSSHTHVKEPSWTWTFRRGKFHRSCRPRSSKPSSEAQRAKLPCLVQEEDKRPRDHYHPSSGGGRVVSCSRAAHCQHTRRKDAACL
jgi:hypothetical protein